MYDVGESAVDSVSSGGNYSAFMQDVTDDIPIPNLSPAQTGVLVMFAPPAKGCVCFPFQY